MGGLIWHLGPPQVAVGHLRLAANWDFYNVLVIIHPVSNNLPQSCSAVSGVDLHTEWGGLLLVHWNSIYYKTKNRRGLGIDFVEITTHLRARSRIFHRGGMDPFWGDFGLQHGHFSVKMYAKTKELGPVGGHVPAHPPPRSAYAPLLSVRVMKSPISC